MPELPFLRQPIAQRVTDRTFGDQKLGQVAELADFKVELDEQTHELSLIVKTRVRWYSLVEGALAQPVPATARGLRPEPVYLHANNNCAVYVNPEDAADPRNGEVLYYKEILPPTAGKPVIVWRPLLPDGTLGEPLASLDDAPEPVLRQGDAFAAQLKQPLILDQLLRYHMAAADQPPFNRYA
jgi:hypothetical protein